jgi:predicted O-linked N-acetylglucosamine transferase (SPINDLY family)
MREQIRNPAVTFVILPERFDRMVEIIRACQLDVLYYWEVGTDTANYFLPFLRLAPVQCTGFGCQTTSGIPEMDYYLSCELVESVDAEDHYCEHLIRARTLLTYQFPVSLDGHPKTRDDFSLAAHQHVYLCAQHLGKIHPDFDPMLADILRRDDQGVVVITKDRWGHAAAQLQQRFQRTVPDVVDRIVFVPRLEPADYHSLTAAADVLLDPPHFCGVNTTYDALALGKPIVTLPSGYHRGGYSSGCYRKMGYTACVAASTENYMDLAVRLGTDADYRQSVEENIQQLNRQLFEDQDAVSECERIFQELIDRARTR